MNYQPTEPQRGTSIARRRSYWIRPEIGGGHPASGAYGLLVGGQDDTDPPPHPPPSVAGMLRHHHAGMTLGSHHQGQDSHSSYYVAQQWNGYRSPQNGKDQSSWAFQVLIVPSLNKPLDCYGGLHPFGFFQICLRPEHVFSSAFRYL